MGALFTPMLVVVTYVIWLIFYASLGLAEIYIHSKIILKLVEGAYIAVIYFASLLIAPAIALNRVLDNIVPSTTWVHIPNFSEYIVFTIYGVISIIGGIFIARYRWLKKNR